MIKPELVASVIAVVTGLGLAGGLASYKAIAVKEIRPTTTSLGLKETQSWQPLSELVDEAMLTSIITENTAPSADRAAIAASAIGIEKDDLLVVDFQSASLCGAGGCAIAAYIASTGDSILFTYANRSAPTEGIVEIVDKEDGSLPCISILTMGAVGPETICYRDNDWITEITS